MEVYENKYRSGHWSQVEIKSIISVTSDLLTLTVGKFDVIGDQITQLPQATYDK